MRECLQEADVQWTNCHPLDEDGDVVMDHKDIELTVHDGSNMVICLHDLCEGNLTECSRHQTRNPKSLFDSHPDHCTVLIP